MGSILETMWTVTCINCDKWIVPSLSDLPLYILPDLVTMSVGPNCKIYITCFLSLGLVLPFCGKWLVIFHARKFPHLSPRSSSFYPFQKVKRYTLFGSIKVMRHSLPLSFSLSLPLSHIYLCVCCNGENLLWRMKTGRHCIISSTFLPLECTTVLGLMDSSVMSWYKPKKIRRGSGGGEECLPLFEDWEEVLSVSKQRVECVGAFDIKSCRKRRNV